MQKKVIEVSELERLQILGALNDRRNALIAEGFSTDSVDDTLLIVMDAPFKRQKTKRLEVAR